MKNINDWIKYIRKPRDELCPFASSSSLSIVDTDGSDVNPPTEDFDIIIHRFPEHYTIKKLNDLAKEVSTWSKDPSRQIGGMPVGAIAVSEKGQVLSQGYNGFPRNIKDTFERPHDKEQKYKYVVHAEMNVIYNATYTGVSLDGATLYVVGLPVCSECAKGIIQTGIKHIIMSIEEDYKVTDRWMQSFEITKEMFDEAGITWEFTWIKN